MTALKTTTVHITLLPFQIEHRRVQCHTTVTVYTRLYSHIAILETVLICSESSQAQKTWPLNPEVMKLKLVTEKWILIIDNLIMHI